MTLESEKLDMNLYAQLEARFKGRDIGKPVDVTDLVSSIVNSPEFGLDWLNRQLANITKSFHISTLGEQLVLVSR